MEIVDRDDILSWKELPLHLQEKILTWLPAKSLCKFSETCKQWNNLSSSADFITNLWAEAPPNRRSWLILYNSRSAKTPWMIYCFFTRTWKTWNSLSFLLKEERNAKRKRYDSDQPEYRIGCEGSAAGLILADVFPTTAVANFNTVCNPLTQSALRLPAFASITTLYKRGIVSGDEHSQNENETYTVLAVGSPTPRSEILIVEIYSSSVKSWRVVGTLPHGSSLMGRMVAYAGSIYMLSRIHNQKGVVGFCIKDGTSIFTPLPVVTSGRLASTLLTWGSRILMAGGIFGRDEHFGEEVLKKVIVWELLKAESEWEEIVTMPPSIVEEFKRKCGTVRWLECTGVGDYVCFIGGLEIAIYDLTKKSWSWLPRFPIQMTASSRFSYDDLMSVAFDPRPHMNVK